MRHQELIDKLTEGEHRLLAMSKQPRDILLRSYGPGKWNGLQLISHIADTDWVLMYRFMKTVAEEGTTSVPFDQDRWAENLLSEERPLDVSMSMIHAARKALVYYLQQLPDEALERKTIHPERGEMTAMRIAEMCAGHALHHAEQLDAIRLGRTWVPKPATY